MGPALVNKCNPKFQATVCSKRRISWYNPGVEISNKKRCLRSNSSKLNSSSHPQQKYVSISKMDSISCDEDYMRFLKSLRANNGSNCMEDDTDFEYKLFLDHLREDGKSYVLEMIDLECEVPIFVKYEGDDGSSDEIKLESQSSGSIAGKRRRPCTAKKGRKCHKSGPAHCKGNRGLRRKSGKVVTCSYSPDCDCKTGEPLEDDSYQTFLNHVRLHGYSMILELENGISVKYEEENEDLTASEVSTTKDALHQSELVSTLYSTSQQLSDSSVYEVDGSSLDLQPHCKLSYFRKKLMAFLNMPYDPKEHEELFKEATSCKALYSQRVLRTSCKSYPTMKHGISYLDHHPDLAEQIKGADRYRALTLLRGFFFWLQVTCYFDM
ncbi:uncharacterized protein LOC131236576 isoform X2 [Magnolia sinica]|uniref:uncharacterized protein LOC131236576 isoform X2 n=1 Tax=Magnolia sinica TaxID=86752 RepID=UPI00265AA2DD|nr:uncharacterized protein LOC131236576 isoform X2 [Magnolia sinica]